MRLSGQPHTVPTLCLGKEPWDTLNRRLVAAHSQFCCQLNKDMHLQILLLHYVLFFVRHCAHLPGTKYRVSWGGKTVLLIKVIYLQLTQPSGLAARNFAAPIFRPEV